MKKIIAILTALICLWSMQPTYTYATVTSSKIFSNNIHEHVYTTNAKVSSSYMCVNPDGTISRIESFGDVILNERYNSSFKIVSQTIIPFELSKFGGFYSGSQYNYFIFGQDNPSHDNNKEVIRIVRYDKNYRRVGSISVKACNTEIPFYLSNTSITENGATLIIRCGHKSYDGQQSAMNIEIRTDKNKVEAIACTPTDSGKGCVLNSGASYIDSYGGVVTVAEKSLTYPDALIMTRYLGGFGPDNFRSGAYAFQCLGAAGKLGNVVPAFTLGGYATNGSMAFAVGNSQPMDGTSPNKNIILVTTPKANFNKQSANISYLTGFAQGDTKSVETPFLVKVNDNLFAILWEQRDGYSDMCSVYYTFIDGTGRRISDNKSINGCLSDCQPVVYGSNIVWFTTNGANVSVYAIPIAGGGKSQVYTSQTNAASSNYAMVYDFNYYISHYPDVRVLYSNDEKAALNHFLTTGMNEGRQGCENFNVSIYAKNYPDLQAAFGGNVKQYYLHYINNGFAEGRNGKTLIKK